MIVRNKNFKNARVTTNHNHRPDEEAMDRVIFTKTLEKICTNNPFMSPLLCYENTKKRLKNRINRKNIQMSYKYSLFVHRKQKRIVPVKPKTIDEFEKLINTAKNTKLYGHDEDGKIFYRGIWQGRTGRNIAFVSERTLKEVVKNPMNVTLLMDGTFRSVPRHLKFRQLYIVNVLIKGRCYPLAYVLMEKKDYHVCFQ